jgi:hypothetical protein
MSRRRRRLGLWQGNDQIASASRRRKPMKCPFGSATGGAPAAASPPRQPNGTAGVRFALPETPLRAHEAPRGARGRWTVGAGAEPQSRRGVGRGARSRSAVGSGAAGAKLLLRRGAAAWDFWSAGRRGGGEWVGTRKSEEAARRQASRADKRRARARSARGE